MDIVVSGHHCTISDAVREQVTERIATVERFRDRVQRVEVVFTANDTKGSPDKAVDAEITLRSRGPVVRAEASAEDKMQAFERAMDKLKAQLRKAADRRKRTKGLRGHEVANSFHEPHEVEQVDDEASQTQNIAGIEVTGDGPLVVKEKEFQAVPLTLAQALDEMELVGHDFFLYSCAETGKPSVVYRRRGYDYGVIRLALP
ncbi:ribosome hibernation-promoting factor, HPF/YfiA family [Aestuariimicrobium ganziense]|uniref:ribosome hibernation-promoting factor, HPF/YfiA family n=1 Tax=Aestuariimicrobium ganziense TaxID=2773677 RepID=UPI001942D419|nr:ribosome-associated translation inhibitor RaiA [Aestuariimicrobium ganziense]